MHESNLNPPLLCVYARHFRYVEDLTNLVNSYNSAMDSLTEPKVIMLAQQIRTVKEVMHSGCKRINWYSLGMLNRNLVLNQECHFYLCTMCDIALFCFLIPGISNFIKQGLQVVSKFKLVINQIQKNESEIDAKLQSMVMANLLKVPVLDKSNELPGKIITFVIFINFNN